MCGIVGLFLKDPALHPTLGAHISRMLIGMSERGPDSAGIALYHRPIAAPGSKLTLAHADPNFRWRELAGALGADLDEEVDVDVRADHAVFTLAGGHAQARAWLASHHPEVRVMSYGQVIEIYKDTGAPAVVSRKYEVAAAEGSHALGHTRMATESAVTEAGSHPFTADADMCLVHNGSLSNYNRLREWLRRRGQAFESDNDTEVAARYFAYRLGEGASLKEALAAGLTDLDGFYTFAMGTRDGFAVLRDGIACKPAVLAETDAWVAMASEYRSLAGLPGVERAVVWEPEPTVVYSWSLGRGAGAGAEA
ncbi:MAG: amidophosphoribosyltransferase [Alphaproteobacteria bacterium]|nr:amidophosphoribosyltransferase [Alphaproteobacteria bacterium]